MEKTMETTGNRSIIITGPESTGKTSIATALANYYKGYVVPEYARSYISGLNHKYTYEDILVIADWQYKQMKNKANTLVVFDTYLIITKIWLKWYKGKYPEWIDKAILETGDSLYLLCATDIEWVPDDVRENGGEARERLFFEYKEELEKFKLNYKIVTGIDERRVLNAIRFVDDYLKK